jgi:hypothetical protein
MVYTIVSASIRIRFVKSFFSVTDDSYSKKCEMTEITRNQVQVPLRATQNEN